MARLIDLSVGVNANTLSPPSTNIRVEITPHRRGPGFWQVSSVNQGLHTGAHIDSPLHVFKDGITTAEISLEQVIGEAVTIDLSFVGANHRITVDDLKRGGADKVKKAISSFYAPIGPTRCTASGLSTSLSHRFFRLSRPSGSWPKGRSPSASTSSRSTARGCQTSPPKISRCIV